MRRRRVASERGQALVETAFVAIIFSLIVFGIVEFGNLFRVQLELQNAVRDGARYAADIHGTSTSCPSGSSVLSQIQSTASDLRSITLSDYSQSTCTGNCQSETSSDVKVTGNYTYTPVTPVGSLLAEIGQSGAFPSLFSLTSTAQLHNEC
jgi:Flp pilus assembly protein TadG